MICINSPHEPTKVVNSRTSKKAPMVWRRRKGIYSGVTFTTYERPSLSDNKPVQLPDQTSEAFNLGKLILSIAQSFTHSQKSAQYDSLWLAQTIEEKLSMAPDPLTPINIAQTTYATLKRFDELAAVQYGARHHLISTVRRRGRPSFSSE